MISLAFFIVAWVALPFSRVLSAVLFLISVIVVISGRVSGWAKSIWAAVRRADAFLSPEMYRKTPSAVAPTVWSYSSTSNPVCMCNDCKTEVPEP